LHIYIYKRYKNIPTLFTHDVTVFIFKDVSEKYNIPLKDSRVLAHFIKIISRNPVKNNEIFL